MAQDRIRLLARIFFVLGWLALALGVAECLYNLWPIISPPVDRSIAALPRTFPGFAFNSLFLPVGPFTAWGVLTVLCDIRDALWEADDAAG